MSAATVVSFDVPTGAGVYAWFRDSECVYAGKASNLRSRLSNHLSISLDLSRSTFRSWVAVRELGLGRAFTRQRPSQMTQEQIDVVTAWIRGCEIAWINTSDRDSASDLEGRLLAHWRPPINVA